MLVLITAAVLGSGGRMQPGAIGFGQFGGLVAVALAWAWTFAAGTERRTPLLRDFVKARLGLLRPSRDAPTPA